MYKDFVLNEVHKYLMNDYIPGTWRDTIFATKIREAYKERFGVDSDEVSAYAYELFKHYALDYNYVSDRLNYFGDL